MVNVTINDKAIQVPEGTTILEAAQMNHIAIPHLCFLKGLNEIGACRVCAVEVEGLEKLVPACNNAAEEGMVIRTPPRFARPAASTWSSCSLSTTRAAPNVRGPATAPCRPSPTT
ncbi:2Fe-2S iron-sulfur cluster-binding protein [uncultured Fretibacterium sp.]|uniref:2Fe-2S iron-sulfur cluster-binding protein n=1 Tax=uncultured Fretibacterium sp. TaxID=1678694 RepID=UPI00262D5A23|nr:2Fe-2S iron-sulfur cluster-binding protein [uncultured Fretibacterium sp.]